VYRKLAVVARAKGTRKVAVANGAESEPASRKDELLLRIAPHLVLDGLQLAAEAVGATEAHLYLHAAPGPQILRALAERAARRLDPLPVSITQAPPRFLAGQETALVNRLGGGPALPTFQPPRVRACWPRCPRTGAAWPRRPGSSATWPPSRPASAAPA
jgi:NADH:ubiquinone oxidoreductase subunit F (NADH-binding)